MKKNEIVVKACSLKLLPKSKWIPAAQTAIKMNHYNAPAVHQLKHALPKSKNIISPLHIAVMTTKYWGIGGVKLTVGFLDNPPKTLMNKILSHMNSWGKFSNVKFAQTSSEAQVRISRTTPSPDDGYWSYLGTDILHIDKSQPTMNLDSFSMQTPDSEFYRVVRHETGHTLGFPHEHMRTEIIKGIDREKAIAYFMRTQGWSRQDVIDQVLTPLSPSSIDASEIDPKSIMCYWLPAEIMKSGKGIPGGEDIDDLDAQFAAKIYPKKVK